MEYASKRVGDVGGGVLVDVDAARRPDGFRPPEPKQPAHLVDHVHPQVSDDAIAVLHEGAPFLLLLHGLERRQRRGSRPQVVVQMGGHRRVGDDPGRPVGEVAVGLDQPDLAQPAAADVPVAGLEVQGIAAPLGVHLDDPAVFARGGDERLALDHVDAHGLFQVKVRAGLHRGDGGQGVPVVGRRDDDDVMLARGQHLAVVRESPGRHRLVPGHGLQRLPDRVLVDIAQRDEAHLPVAREGLEVDASIPAAADDADPGSRL